MTPYVWADPGLGYSWENGNITDIPQNTLLCDATSEDTCGNDYNVVATVSVTDAGGCGATVTAKIRNEIGDWVLIESMSAYPVTVCPSGICSDIYEYTNGNQKWSLYGENNCVQNVDDCFWRHTNSGSTPAINPPPCGTPAQCYQANYPDCGSWDGNPCSCIMRFGTYYEWGCPTP